MRGISLTRCVAVALFAGALACARNQETGTAAVQREDTTATDTTGQNPPGYRGMERDTTMRPSQRQQPVDTFLQQQGTNPRADTAGYGGLERDTTHTDTTGYRNQTDTTGYQQQGQADSVRLPHDSTRIHRDSAGVDQPDSGSTGQR